jgi:glycosyltransferase involved in cell wall biosynthesis
MKISILISNYNKEKYVEECISSVIDQDYNDLEIIIIDNNSTDNSLKIINKFSDKIIIKTKNRISEFSPANQIDLIIESFKISTGEIICLLDGDDFFLPNKITKISQHFSKNENVQIIFDTPCVSVNNKTQPLKLKKKFFNNNWPSTIPTSGISFRRNFFELCLKSNLFYKYPTLEIDFRLNFFSKKIYNKYIHLNEYLTFYRKVNDGIMSKLKKFSKNWWIKRLDAHYFIYDIYKQNKITHKKNYDFYLTKAIVYLLSKKFK